MNNSRINNNLNRKSTLKKLLLSAILKTYGIFNNIFIDITRV